MAREDFRIIQSKPVGYGSFGTVFLAERLSDGRRVALKTVLHAGEWGAERIEAERKGAILQQRFAAVHAMVPEIYDFGADGDDFYIAMEFIDGASLEALLRRGPLPVADAAGHARWLCGFMERAHAFSGVVDGRSHRIVHTDLKPAHLMIGSDGERKVLDFGIAKALEESRELGTDIGRTIAYASPERLVSDQISPHADFWSLGVMLFEMVCGHRPYPALEGPRFRRELEHAITSNAPRAPMPETCPAGLRAVINKLLAFQVEHRYASATAIAADLDLFLSGGTPAALSIYETPATTPVRRPAVAVADAGGTTPRLGGSAPVPPPPTTPRPSASAVPPTEPNPAAVRVAAPAAAPALAHPPAPVRKSRRRRLVAALPSLLLVLLVATEGVAWIFAERFRDSIPAIDERNVTAHHQAYDAVDEWALLDIGLGLRVHGRLVPALTAVGDRVITDFRREEPAMGPAEWAQAQEALTWALDISSRTAQLRAKRLIAEGHVRRLAAQSARGGAAALQSQAALAKFREAAAADPKSFDPYLAMARIQVYALSDVDAAAAAIADAEKRGYTSGRRESALLGDGYMRRGLAGRRRAGVLTGEQRVRELVGAKADFERCVAFFDPIVAFANAAKNLEVCKAQVVRIDRQLNPEPDGV